MTDMDTGPRAPLSEPDKDFVSAWREGKGKRDIIILALSAFVLLVGILLGIAAITSDLF
jgi:hypothetical protein